MKKSTEQQDAIIQAYVGGATARQVADLCKCSTATVRAVFKSRGIAMPERKRGARAKKPRDIVVPQESYDHLRRIPDTPCGCERGCGLTFKRGLGQRYRVFAPGCPNHAEDIARRNTESAARRRAAKVASGEIGLTSPGKNPETDGRPHVVVHWCAQCGGMSWRRPKNGAACRCGQFFQEEQMVRPDGRIVTIGELPAERLAVLGVVDKYQPAEDYCEKNRKIRRRELKDEKGHDPIVARAAFLARWDAHLDRRLAEAFERQRARGGSHVH